MDISGGPVVQNPSAIAGDTSLTPGPGRFHMPRGNEAHVPQLLSPSAATIEARAPRAATIVKVKSKKKSAAWQTVKRKHICPGEKNPRLLFVRELHPLLEFCNKRSRCNEKPMCRRNQRAAPARHS